MHAMPSPKDTYSPIPILFHNHELIVVDKPNGLPVQGGAGVKVDLTSILRKMHQQDKPQAIHRIDADTSGVIAYALTPAKMAMIKKKWDAAEKLYLAIVKGKIQKKTFYVNSELKEKNKSKEALTHFKVFGSFGPFTLVGAKLITGRKHQIRKQLAEINKPVLGDDKHGDFEFNRQWNEKLKHKKLFLHAWKLTLPIHPRQTETFEARLPQHFKELLARYNAKGLL